MNDKVHTASSIASTAGMYGAAGADIAASEAAARITMAAQDKIAQIQNLPTDQVFVAMANLLGLQDWAAQRGVPQAKSNQCLSDQKMIDREVQLTTDVGNQYPEFQGTPAFIINGKMLSKDVGSWEKLEPQLQAALK